MAKNDKGRIALAAMKAAQKAAADGDWLLAYRMYSIAFVKVEEDLGGDQPAIEMYRALLRGFAQKALETGRTPRSPDP